MIIIDDKRERVMGNIYFPSALATIVAYVLGYVTSSIKSILSESNDDEVIERGKWILLIANMLMVLTIVGTLFNAQRVAAMMIRNPHHRPSPLKAPLLSPLPPF
jgi:hypothetical protein